MPLVNDRSTDYTVSVIIPAFQAENHIVQAIESVLCQTYTPQEIIVVDDGSTDNTGSAVKRYGDKVIYIYQNNSGPASARNSAIHAAKSTWVAFLDSDDIWTPNKLELQFRLLKRNTHLQWAVSNFYYFNPAKNLQEVAIHAQHIRKQLINGAYLANLFDAMNDYMEFALDTYIIKRSVFEKAGLFREELRYSEDTDLFWRIAAHWPQIGYVNKPLTTYVQHENNLTKITDHEKILSSILTVFDDHLNRLSEMGMENKIIPFVNRKLRKWTYLFYRQQDYEKVKVIAEHFRRILPLSFKFLMRFLLIKPARTHRLGIKILHWLKFYKN